MRRGAKGNLKSRMDSRAQRGQQSFGRFTRFANDYVAPSAAALAIVAAFVALSKVA